LEKPTRLARIIVWASKARKGERAKIKGFLARRLLISNLIFQEKTFRKGLGKRKVKVLGKPGKSLGQGFQICAEGGGQELPFLVGKEEKGFQTLGKEGLGFKNSFLGKGEKPSKPLGQIIWGKRVKIGNLGEKGFLGFQGRNKELP